MIEIIATTLEEAIAIETSGAHRIELVADMDLDGLTPALEVVRAVTEAVSIPVNVMVRNHDAFTFTTETFQAMLAYIQDLKSTKAKGIVWGSLKHGRVDFDQLMAVKTLWHGDITFHRAIDQSSHLEEDYRRLSEEVTYVLTSGGPGKAQDHMDVLDRLYCICPEKLLIGSGVYEGNIEAFQKRYPKSQQHIGSGARLQGQFHQGIDVDKVKKIAKRRSNQGCMA